MKKLFTENNLLILLAGVLAMHMLSIPFLVIPDLVSTGPSWLGLDDSWAVALNYAFDKNWTWGKDIAYTYGPLGFLATRIGMGIPKWIFVCFDLFITANFFFVFKQQIIHTGNRFLSILLVIIITLLIKPLVFGGLIWLLLFFQFFWMHRAYLNPKPRYLITAGIFSILSFYIKLNGGLVGIPLFFIFLLLLLWTKQINRNILFILSGIFAVLVFVSASLLHVYLPGYIKAGIYLIKGSNDIMYLNETHEQTETSIEIAYLFMLMLQAVMVLFFIRCRNFFADRKNYVCLFLMACGAVYLFMLRKQSIVRNDLQHLEEFFQFAPLAFVLANMLLTGKIAGQLLKAYFVITLFILLCYTGHHPVESLFKERYSVPGKYVKEYAYNNQENYTNQQQRRWIPGRILDRIGKQTVDVFPWDAEYMIQNRLNYKPRPVFQSLLACTRELQQMNLEAYLREAPRFLIYDYDAIDNRYPFSEEGALNLLIANNYTIIDTFTSNERLRLLLAAPEKCRPVTISETVTEKIRTTQEIETKGAGMISLNVNYNLMGKLRAFFYKPSPVNVMLMRRNGQWLTYKTSPLLLKSGLMTEKLILSTRDFSDLVSGEGYLEPVVKIKLGLDSNFYQPEADVTYYTIEGSEKKKRQNTTGTIGLSRFRSGDLVDMDHEQVLAIWGGEAVTDPVPVSPGKYRLTIFAKGTPSEQVYPGLYISVNGKKIGSLVSQKDYHAHEFMLDLETDSAEIKLVMHNDHYNPETKEDRNAFIKTITLQKLTAH